jgi:hypothetical protein
LVRGMGELGLRTCATRPMAQGGGSGLGREVGDECVGLAAGMGLGAGTR